MQLQRQRSEDSQPDQQGPKEIDLVDLMMLLAMAQDADEPFDFVPQIECGSSARNGLVSVKISNLDELIKGNGRFRTALDPCFQLIWRKISDTETCDDIDKDTEWHSRHIAIGHLGGDENNEFAMKLPVYLYEYSIEFRMRTINKETEEWMSWSAPTTFAVPSFLVNSSFNVGDEVIFRFDDEVYGQSAEIFEVLDDNKYKLGYYQYDASKGARNDKNSWVKVEHVINSKNIFRSGLDQEHEINLTDFRKMEQLMLIKRDDTESIDVFDAILDFYQHESLEYSVRTYGFQLALSYISPIAQFVSKNIFEFLYEPMQKLEFRSNCLIDPYNDGKLDMNNLTQYAIRRHRNILKKGIVDKPFGQSFYGYRCDFCSSGINPFEYSFQCNGDCTATHDICVNCVYTTIKLGAELEKLLCPLLTDELNDDSIHEIVAYVIGRPICMQ